ncbi:MAG: ankyrin repeat domain-containing protein [Epsilonproteobacteria bacterium]|nr:ankyrin repeat domain-containing protein [Campylobacterota bacterium]
MTMMHHGLKSLVGDMIRSNISINRLNLNDIEINNRDEHGKNLLYYAIETKNINNVKLLIESGIELNVMPHQHAMMHAVYCDYLESVQYLLEKGIDINLQDREGKTALMCAAYYGRVDICCYLLNEGADLFLMDQKYDMAIDFAYRTIAKRTRDILQWRMLYEESLQQ